MSQQDKGLSPRSQVANRLMQLNGLSKDKRVAQALRDLEREALTGNTGSSEHLGFYELSIMLKDASHVISNQNPEQQLAYLERLRARMRVWQRGETERKGSAMGFLDKLSKTKREDVRKLQLIKDLEGKVFELEQRNEILTGEINQLDIKRDEQVKLATTELPGSVAYNMAKTRHTQLTDMVKSKRFEAQAVIKVINTNQTYLSSLREEMSIKSLGNYMPVSMEKMEMDLANSNHSIEVEMDKLRQGTDMLDDFMQERNQRYASLEDQSDDNEFDRAVVHQAQGEQVLDSFAQMVKNASSAEKPGQAPIEKHEEGPGNV